MATPGVWLAAVSIGSIGSSMYGAPVSALAPPGLGDLETHADDVTIDTERRELVLRGNVKVEASPFHLRSEALTLRRSARGVEVDGAGKLAFCPCLGTPLTLSFSDALVAPPSDLVLRNPRLEVYGVPVLWLPYFWLRAPDRPGLLPPEIAYRGNDGMYLGAGVHLPWARVNAATDIRALRDRAEMERQRELGFDVRGGAYLKGGYAVEGDLRTPTSRTKLRWDWLERGGLTVDARGGTGGVDGAAWDVSAVRGSRALASTLSLDEAARPLDRVRGETFVRRGPVSFSAAAVTSTLRGNDGTDQAFGPLARATVSDALGHLGNATASVSGGAFREPLLQNALSFANGEAEMVVRHPLGVVSATLDGRAEVAAASDGRASARGVFTHDSFRLGLPLVRAFASDNSTDPWRHRIEPRLALNALAMAADSENVPLASKASAFSPLRGVMPMFAPFGRDDSGAVVIPEVGLDSAFGRYATRDGFDVDLASGYAAGAVSAPVARARVAAAGSVVAISAEGGVRAIAATGGAFTTRVRIGPTDGWNVEGRAGGREGVDPTLARALAPSLRDVPTAYFARDGFSAGGTLSLPFTRNVIARGGTDFDLATGALLGARGSVDLRDGCGCATLRVFGSHRLGREGVDLWLALELGESKKGP